MNSFALRKVLRRNSANLSWMKIARFLSGTEFFVISGQSLFIIIISVVIDRCSSISSVFVLL